MPNITAHAADLINLATVTAHEFAVAGGKLTAFELAQEVAKLETHENVVDDYAAAILPIVAALYDDATWSDALTLQYAYATSGEVAAYINGLTLPGVEAAT